MFNYRLGELSEKGIGVNRVIMFMIYSDFFIQMGWGLINPIIAVFMTEQIAGGDVAVAGIAASILMVTQAVVQIPVARWIDAKKVELDDFKVRIAEN